MSYWQRGNALTQRLYSRHLMKSIIKLSKAETLVYMTSYMSRFIDDLRDMERRIRTRQDMELADKVLLILAGCKIEIGKIDDS